MAGETSSATPNSSDAQLWGNIVAIVLTVLALAGTVAILLWMWAIGDFWLPRVSGAIPPCLPGIDHHCQ
jgi:hypothetical protein